MAKPRTIQAEEFIEQFCSTRARIRYDRTVILDGQEATLRLLRGALILENDKLQLGFPHEVITAALEKYLTKLDRQLVSQHVAELAHQPGTSDEGLRAWLRAVSGQEDELDLLVMKHFIWQVKRKMAGQPVEYHVMPVLCGKTGSGKSIAVERLLAPLKQLVEAGRDCNLFEDSREWAIFHRMYVVVFDEMSKATKTDVDAMKKTITAESVSYRQLSTHDIVTGRMVSTFIGTSNNFISEVILDPTSARRFWQISSQKVGDWEAVNGLDYTQIWRCVDENAREAPIRGVWKRIQERQHNEFRAKSAVEEWFCEGWRLAVKPTERMKASDAFTKFKEWAGDNNHGKLISSTKFGMELSKIDGVEKTRTADGVYYNIARQGLVVLSNEAPSVAETLESKVHGGTGK